ncbi:hypothetical protein QTI66_21390 [Variovorax sp. J22R133]|uniref:hypothetical protein n=1 Tax=Variovorax brevis TaxID=3053503 RepID=UPI002576C6A0|nr:hypothetical protein [Variovorax sp. J22R133]MDM0114721.1 hypothetical protein [Variovorax sp. J22R133]
MTALRWLEFDYSEGTDDTGVFDAMASVELKYAADVEAEIARVLNWASEDFAGRRGPVEEGGDWDSDLGVIDEPGEPPRRCFTLSISGTEAFCEAFREQFVGDAV